MGYFYAFSSISARMSRTEATECIRAILMWPVKLWSKYDDLQTTLKHKKIRPEFLNFAWLTALHCIFLTRFSYIVLCMVYVAFDNVLIKEYHY